MKTLSVKGIVFDFDGTLARTMEDHFVAWKHVMKDFDIDLCPQDYYPLEGLSVNELPIFFLTKYGKEPKDPAVAGALANELVTKKDAFYLSNSSVEFYPGVERLITDLAERRVPIGIVTTGLRHRLFKSVPASFLDKFKVVVTGDMTARGKPHPDPYLRCFRELGIHPEDCMVVENAPLGIKAAKSAGAYCVSVCSTLDESFLRDADCIVRSFEDLRRLPLVEQFLR